MIIWNSHFQKQPQEVFANKKVLKISQYSQENTFVGVFFQYSCMAFRTAPLLKGDSNTSVFLWNLRNV